jgi:uncharacterized protein Yka (UPF0111/DUF47 family)
LEREIEILKVHLNSTEDEKTKLDLNIKEAEKYVDNAEALQTINKRVKNIEEKIDSYKSKIDENYTTYL